MGYHFMVGAQTTVCVSVCAMKMTMMMMSAQRRGQSEKSVRTREAARDSENVEQRFNYSMVRDGTVHCSCGNAAGQQMLTAYIPVW